MEDLERKRGEGGKNGGKERDGRKKTKKSKEREKERAEHEKLTWLVLKR